MRLVCRIYMDLFSRSNRIFVKHQSQMTLESWDTMGLEKHWQRWFSMLYLYKSQRRRTAHSPCSKDRVATWEWQMHFDCVTLSHSRCSCCKPTAWCSSRLEGRWHAFCKIQKGIRGICWYFMIFHDLSWYFIIFYICCLSCGLQKSHTAEWNVTRDERTFTPVGTFFSSSTGSAQRAVSDPCWNIQNLQMIWDFVPSTMDRCLGQDKSS